MESNVVERNKGIVTATNANAMNFIPLLVTKENSQTGNMNRNYTVSFTGRTFKAYEAYLEI